MATETRRRASFRILEDFGALVGEKIVRRRNLSKIDMGEISHRDLLTRKAIYEVVRQELEDGTPRTRPDIADDEVRSA